MKFDRDSDRNVAVSDCVRMILLRSIAPFAILFLIVGTMLYPSFMYDFAGIISFILVLVFLLQFVVLYQLKNYSSKEITTVAVLGAFSAAARIPFASIPSVQPCTFIIMMVGFVFGPYAGFMVGAETALLSNFFLGQGPWTPWQMLAWGIAGLVGYGVSFVKNPRAQFYVFLLAGVGYGYIFGIIMNLWMWLGFVRPLTFTSFMAVEMTSFPFDTLHALGNAVFISLFAPKFEKILKRYSLKFGVFVNS